MSLWTILICLTTTITTTTIPCLTNYTYWLPILDFLVINNYSIPAPRFCSTLLESVFPQVVETSWLLSGLLNHILLSFLLSIFPFDLPSVFSLSSRSRKLRCDLKNENWYSRHYFHNPLFVYFFGFNKKFRILYINIAELILLIEGERGGGRRERDAHTHTNKKKDRGSGRRTKDIVSSLIVRCHDLVYFVVVLKFESLLYSCKLKSFLL